MKARCRAVATTPSIPEEEVTDPSMHIQFGGTGRVAAEAQVEKSGLQKRIPCFCYGSNNVAQLAYASAVSILSLRLKGQSYLAIAGYLLAKVQTGQEAASLPYCRPPMPSALARLSWCRKTNSCCLIGMRESQKVMTRGAVPHPIGTAASMYRSN